MSEETIKFEGKLSLNRQERMKANVRMQGLVKSLRDLLDPTKPVERLETEMIAAQALDLAALQIKYKELLQEADIIRQYLPRER